MKNRYRTLLNMIGRTNLITSGFLFGVLACAISRNSSKIDLQFVLAVVFGVSFMCVSWHLCNITSE